MNRRKRQAAESSKTTRNASEESAPAALFESGLRHFRAGRHLDAQLCRQALEASPDHAQTLHLVGQISLHAKQYDHATEWISRAIRLDPKVEYLASLGITLQQQGRREEARLFRQTQTREFETVLDRGRDELRARTAEFSRGK
jgi:Flp pilus assembly protein TadD